MNVDTPGDRYPVAGQEITAIAVRDLQAAVLTATVSAQEDERIVLRFEPAQKARAERVGLDTGTHLKLLYSAGEMVWRLGCVVRAAGDEVELEPTSPPRPSERREYIRAEMVLTLAARPLAATEFAAAREEAAALPLPEGEDSWQVELVDLSGSGMRLRLGDDLKAEALVDFRIQLEGRAEPLALIGRVVRTVPKDEGFDVAVQFESPSLADQDALINLVFRVRYDQLGQ